MFDNKDDDTTCWVSLLFMFCGGFIFKIIGAILMINDIKGSKK